MDANIPSADDDSTVCSSRIELEGLGDYALTGQTAGNSNSLFLEGEALAAIHSHLLC